MGTLPLTTKLTCCRGAYCSMTIISLLKLPLELPPSAPIKGNGLASFADNLPEYLSRCMLEVPFYL